MSQPYGFVSEYAPRLRGHLNALLTPIIPVVQVAPTSRKTNRGTTVINYAEDAYGDEDFEDSDGPRRLTGLRSRNQHDPNQSRDALMDKLSHELTEPERVQGIWREWMGKPRYARFHAGGKEVDQLDFSAPLSSLGAYRTEQQLHGQDTLPLTLIPIRIELDIAPFVPHQSLPLPPRYQELGVNPSDPAFRRQEETPAYRLRDVFLWNLHETLTTPDQFAMTMVNELDLPPMYIAQISGQVRQQLEDYAGVAMHPLFHNTTAINSSNAQREQTNASPDHAQTPALPSTPMPHAAPQTNGTGSPSKTNGAVTAAVDPLPADQSDPDNPDDMYRCILVLSINLLNKLYTDQFEWSLLHPPGYAEMFAKQTCADQGLGGEWVPVMTHAIYEAVLRHKKEACESGSLAGAGYGGELDNSALPGQEAGWRYDGEGLCDQWEPTVAILSKEGIQRREDDRERQIRRQRRETARFSSSANMTWTQQPPGGGTPGPAGGGYFDAPDADTPGLGRGERSKKKRRFRSLSPAGRSGTPGGAPSEMGFGGLGGGPTDDEKWRWRCTHCEIPGNAAWALRDGPAGPRSLCNNCGLLFERDKKLPRLHLRLHRGEVPIPLSYR